MALDLNAIDLSAVEALAKIKTEHDQLGERLRAMASKRDQVSAEVYQRVHADYRKRIDELAAQAAPLKQSAGEVYRALRSELASLEDAFASARLDREEIDFRHTLGEFDGSELQLRVAAVDVRIEEHGHVVWGSGFGFAATEQRAGQGCGNGEARAREVRATADRDATVIKATAQQEAETIRGRGDAKAADIYNRSYGKDPEFASFFRTMRAYDNAIKDGEPMVLSPDSDFFKYFKNERGGR